MANLRRMLPIGLWLALGVPAAAQVELDRFYPPAVAVGGATTVKAEGKFANWPVAVWLDRAEIECSPGSVAGELNITVPPDAAPGVVWIRLHDSRSASPLLPLILSPAGVTVETEPNDRIDPAPPVTLPQVLVGRLEKSGDVDSYPVSVKSGQTLVVSVTAHQLLRSPMDAVLQLVDARGNVILQSDDQRGLDPQLVYTAPQDSELWVRLFAFPLTPDSTIGFAGAASFVYTVAVTTGPFVDHVLPLVVSDEPASAASPHGWNLPEEAEIKRRAATECSPAVAYLEHALGWQWQPAGPAASTHWIEAAAGSAETKLAKLPGIVSGHLSQPAEVDRVRFDVTKDLRYVATVQARQFGFPLDSVLRIVDPRDNGRELARNDDQTGDQYDASVEYKATADGQLELQISDLVDAGGPRHAYSVLIEEARPIVSLTLADDRYQVKAGATLEIPVSVSRLRGFSHPLRITAEPLPAGVQVESVISEPKGDSSKSVKLKLTAAAETTVQGTFRIVGHGLNDDGGENGETFLAAHRLRDVISLHDIWLTVAAAK